MTVRDPKALLLLFLLIVCLMLPSCSGGKLPGSTTAPQTTESPAANVDELIGSWMRLSGGQMEIYTFRRGGEVTVYEMESATVVAGRLTGKFSLTGDRLTLEFGGSKESHTLLTGSGNALILDGEILTPAQEPEG